MSKFYFLNLSFEANTASSNRTLAYLRGLSELGISTHVIFLIPDNKRSKIKQSLNNIYIEYYWEKYFYVDRKGIRSLIYLLYVIKFLLHIRKGDTVYLYGMADVLHFILKKKNINVYHEKTEHPLVSPLGTGLYKPSIETYVKDCRKLDGLIVISTALKKFFIDKGISENKIHIINVIVDSARFNGITKSSNVERYIAYCGTASNSKDGVDILIKAFYHVHRSHPDVKLYIIGRIPKAKDEMENIKLIQDLHLEKSIVLTGIVSAKDMPQTLTNAIALALARPNNLQAQNGFPTKSGEYLLSGVPAVFTAVGDIPLLLTDKENSLIASPDNPEDFAQKLIWIIENPQEASAIAENGKRLANLQFNYLTETKKIVKIISKNR